MDRDALLRMVELTLEELVELTSPSEEEGDFENKDVVAVSYDSSSADLLGSIRLQRFEIDLFMRACERYGVIDGDRKRIPGPGSRYADYLAFQKLFSITGELRYSISAEACLSDSDIAESFVGEKVACLIDRVNPATKDFLYACPMGGTSRNGTLTLASVNMPVTHFFRFSGVIVEHPRGWIPGLPALDDRRVRFIFAGRDRDVHSSGFLEMFRNNVTFKYQISSTGSLVMFDKGLVGPAFMPLHCNGDFVQFIGVNMSVLPHLEEDGVVAINPDFYAVAGDILDILQVKALDMKSLDEPSSDKKLGIPPQSTLTISAIASLPWIRKVAEYYVYNGAAGKLVVGRDGPSDTPVSYRNRAKQLADLASDFAEMKKTKRMNAKWNRLVRTLTSSGLSINRVVVHVHLLLETISIYAHKQIRITPEDLGLSLEEMEHLMTDLSQDNLVTLDKVTSLYRHAIISLQKGPQPALLRGFV